MVVNMYVVFALFFLSSAVILACLDRLKMRYAIALFMVLCLVLVAYIPLAIWGGDITEYCQQCPQDSVVQSVLTFANRKIQFSDFAVSSATLILAVIAIICATSAVILAVHTAKAIRKFVEKIKQNQHPKVPQKQNFEPKLVHSKILYKRILYLRFCRLNS